jgi:predicted NUDIX family phosphoesterase
MKYALCIKATQANDPINTWETFLLPRTGEDGCETNPEYLQIIPYITLGRSETNENGDIIGESEFLTYQRGTSSDEYRLISNRSIGFGGHMDTLPPEGMSLQEHIYNEAVREVLEETGFKIDYDSSVFDNCDRYIPTSTCNGVGKVYIGLNLIFTYPTNMLSDLVLEKGHIENPIWYSAYELKKKALNQLLTPQRVTELYEDWSLKTINSI